MTDMISAHFSKTEMMCGCGDCGKYEMDSEFMRMLEEIRKEYGKPMIVSSGFRCSEWNQKKSSTGPNGPHTTARAADIRVFGSNAHELEKVALANGATGIGVSQKGPHKKRFLHIDNLGGINRPWMWSY